MQKNEHRQKTRKLSQDFFPKVYLILCGKWEIKVQSLSS